MPGETQALEQALEEIETTTERYRVRHATEGDRAFLCTAWYRSYEGSRFARTIGPHYRSVECRLINRLLVRPTVHTKVACDTADPAMLFGFVVYEFPLAPDPGGLCLHYLFVRPTMRGEGIARRLTRGLDFADCSHEWAKLPWRPERAL